MQKRKNVLLAVSVMLCLCTVLSSIYMVYGTSQYNQSNALCVGTYFTSQMEIDTDAKAFEKKGRQEVKKEQSNKKSVQTKFTHAVQQTSHVFAKKNHRKPARGKMPQLPVPMPKRPARN